MARFTAELVTDVGQVRDHNEDYALVRTVHHPHGNFHLWIVADGMGGGARGEVASKLAAQTVAEYVSRCEWDQPEEALRTAFEAANAAVYAEGTGDGAASRSQMGTTLVVALVDDASGETVVANVGDSRAYLVRGNEIRQLTRDHSLVAERLAAGLITEEEARAGDERNIITRAIGTDPTVTVDVMPRGSLGPGMRLLLCSDGLHGLVPDEEILREVATTSLHRSARALVRDANAAGGRDNITVLVAGFGGADARAPLVPPAQFRAAPTVRGTRRLPHPPALLAAAGGGIVALLLFGFGIGRLLDSSDSPKNGRITNAISPYLQPSAAQGSPGMGPPSPTFTAAGEGVPTGQATSTVTRTPTPAPTHTPSSTSASTAVPTTDTSGTQDKVLWRQPSATLLSGDSCQAQFQVHASSTRPAYVDLGLQLEEKELARGTAKELDGVKDPIVGVNIDRQNLPATPGIPSITIWLVLTVRSAGGQSLHDDTRIVGKAEVDGHRCVIEPVFSAVTVQP